MKSTVLIYSRGTILNGEDFILYILFVVSKHVLTNLNLDLTVNFDRILPKFDFVI